MTCKNWKGQHPLGAEVWSSQEVDDGCVKMRQLNFVVSGPKFTHFFAQPGRGCVDYLLFRFLIGRTVPDIFAIEV